jgi:hypothetical protein
VAPQIVESPDPVTTFVGAAARFTITTTGTEPLFYEWRKGGTPLANGGHISGVDTATLKLSNVQTTDAGAYDVIVSNDVGKKTSVAAALTVNPAPSIRLGTPSRRTGGGWTIPFTTDVTGSFTLWRAIHPDGPWLSAQNFVNSAPSGELIQNETAPDAMFYKLSKD